LCLSPFFPGSIYYYSISLWLFTVVRHSLPRRAICPWFLHLCHGHVYGRRDLASLWVLYRPTSCLLTLVLVRELWYHSSGHVCHRVLYYFCLHIFFALLCLHEDTDLTDHLAVLQITHTNFTMAQIEQIASASTTTTTTTTRSKAKSKATTPSPPQVENTFQSLWDESKYPLLHNHKTYC
jgi:hypothetical protein